MTDKPKKTARDYVRASESRKVARGGKRMGGVLPPDVAAAMKRLQAAGYARSGNGCIARALIDACAYYCQL